MDREPPRLGALVRRLEGLQRLPRSPLTAEAAAVAVLLAVLVACIVRSWLAWGHLDVDYGREMYVPLRLLRGDVIYRDVRYPYGPLSPYLHAVGYWLWKAHLDVLYASGLTSTALVVATLYLVARQLGSVAAALLGTALATIDLMFMPGSPSTFSYVFPYAYPALHGTLFLLVALGGALRVVGGGGRVAAAVSGTGIGLALLAKPEFGAMALLVGLLVPVVLVLLGERRRIPSHTIALALPALALPLVGYGFLTMAMPAGLILSRGLFAREYFESSRHIGWLIAGIPPGSTLGAVAEILGTLYWGCGRWYLVAATSVSAFAFGAAVLAGARRKVVSHLGVLVAVGLTGAATFHALRDVSLLDCRYAAFPALLAMWLVVESWGLWRQWRRDGVCAPSNVQRWLAVAVAFGLLARIPARAVPLNYANFYLGPGIVLAVHLLVDLLPRGLSAIGGSRWAARSGAMALVGAVVLAVSEVRYDQWGTRRGELSTPRGTLRLPVTDQFALAYAQAMELVNSRTPPGASILAIPCETALYFLTDRGNHLYETGLVGVVTTEAAERAYIAELERDPPVLVLTSNRPLFEYGLTTFGVDYGRLIAAWIQQHYSLEQRVGERRLRIAVWRPR